MTPFGDVSVHHRKVGLLHDDDPEVRKEAALALGIIGDERAVEPLIDALHDDDLEVREWAAWALGMVGDERAVEPLIDALLHDEDPRVRWRVIYALERIRAVVPNTPTSEYIYIP